MAEKNFAPALARVLVHEGGWSNHAKDPGGATNRGVTQRVYDGYRARSGLARRSVRHIEMAEVLAIYRRQYWAAIKGDELPAGVDYVVFDGAVNSGPSQAVKWLQRALGVKVDGNLGEATLDAVEAHPDHDRLVADIMARRMAFLRALRTWSTFGKGWTHRVNEARAIGQAWATGSVGPTPTHVPGSGRRATIEDAKRPPSKAAADALSGGGLVATTVTQATEAIRPVAEAVASLSMIVTVLTVLGLLALTAGLVYRAIATERAKRLADALDVTPVSYEPEPAPEPLEAGELRAA